MVKNKVNMEINKIYCESNLETMAKMPDCFIDLTVTSPPYDDLRNYNGYSFPFEDIAKELYRVTKQGGVLVWIVGDSVINGSESGTSFKQALFFIQCGFNLHDTMIYEKDASPFPSDCRYTAQFEYMFVFSKGKPKTVNLIKDKLNAAGGNIMKSVVNRMTDGTMNKTRKNVTIEIYGTRGNIWKYGIGFNKTTKDVIAFEHPAIFPEQLCADHIYSWSNENDLIYDPFMGSGTTAKMAHLQKRNWIGSEISQEYVDLANKRIEPYLKQLRLNL
jgi:site-specific DNA-methyltransferase (adenine-specific)